MPLTGLDGTAVLRPSAAEQRKMASMERQITHLKQQQRNRGGGGTSANTDHDTGRIVASGKTRLARAKRKRNTSAASAKSRRDSPGQSLKQAADRQRLAQAKKRRNAPAKGRVHVPGNTIASLGPSS